MHTFTDTKGRKWTLSLNVTTLKRVKAETGVDLFDVAGGKLFETLANDPGMTADVLFSIAMHQHPQVTAEDFGEALGGDALAEAGDALNQAIIAFFPKGRGAALARVAEKMKEIEGQAEAAVLEAIDSPAVTREIERQLATYGESPTKLPAPSA